MASRLFLVVFVLIHLHFTLGYTETTLSRAAGILSDSGYISMSVALYLAPPSLSSDSTSLTVFAVSDAVFGASGGLTSELLRLHLLPVARPLPALKALPFGAEVATVLQGESLRVTSLPGDGELGMNNVTVTGSIFDDSSLVILAVETFFSTCDYFNANRFNLGPANPRNMSPEEFEAKTSAFYRFRDATTALRSNGGSLMAAFMELEFQASMKLQSKVTVFAPEDDAMLKSVNNLSEYSVVFHRHVCPITLSWNELVKLDTGAVLPSNTDFFITVGRNGTVLVLNGGVTVVVPDLYRSNGLVIHLVSDLMEPENFTKINRRLLTKKSGDDFRRELLKNFEKGIASILGALILAGLGKLSMWIWAHWYGPRLPDIEAQNPNPENPAGQDQVHPNGLANQPNVQANPSAEALAPATFWGSARGMVVWVCRFVPFPWSSDSSQQETVANAVQPEPFANSVQPVQVQNGPPQTDDTGSRITEAVRDMATNMLDTIVSYLTGTA